jgi:cyclic pyranopterin phosphate synthase
VEKGQNQAANPFSHLDETGAAKMVDVSAKPSTYREAEAKGMIIVGEEVMAALAGRNVEKGDVLAVARIAGIMAAKKVPELIPLCHSVPLSRCDLDFTLDQEKGEIYASCRVAANGVTGVEMEALIGVNLALLTIYDMCKAIEKGMVVGPAYLSSKSGGKSGPYHFSDIAPPYGSVTETGAVMPGFRWLMESALADALVKRTRQLGGELTRNLEDPIRAVLAKGDLKDVLESGLGEYLERKKIAETLKNAVSEVISEYNIAFNEDFDEPDPDARDLIKDEAESMVASIISQGVLKHIVEQRLIILIKQAIELEGQEAKAAAKSAAKKTPAAKAAAKEASTAKKVAKKVVKKAPAAKPAAKKA